MADTAEKDFNLNIVVIWIAPRNHSGVQKGNLEDIPISPLSLRKYLTYSFRDIPGFRAYFLGLEVLDGLEAMKIMTIAQLNAIIPEGFKTKYKEVSKPSDFVTFTTIIRDILIIHDSNSYFNKAWKSNYNTFDYHSWKIHSKFGLDKRYFPPEKELRPVSGFTQCDQRVLHSEVKYH